jgi:tetratricopeptide (TPR) repeat protein
LDQTSLDYILLREEAYQKFRCGDSKDAKNLLEKGLSLAKKDKNKSIIEFFLGEIQILEGNYESAISHYEKASQLTKSIELKAFFHKNIGLHLSTQGREEEAIKRYECAHKIKPDDFESLRYMGVSLSKLEREEEAIEKYEAALKIKPDDYDSLRHMGVSLISLGREEEAVEKYGYYLKPEDWRKLVSKAFSLESIDKDEEAARIYASILSNKEKVKDEFIIQIANFEINVLNKKESNYETCIINKVLEAFQSEKIDLFRDINIIETGFKKFIDSKRSIPKNFFSFLCILRKWNSYTPILPSEKGDNKGGGYFLHHQGKGIVIDPGFNFIENFYKEGFKIADIDAVLITHSHNDHTVDLESILTLIHEHNEVIKDDKTNHAEEKLNINPKKIDLFMNLGTFKKYSGWINLKDCKKNSGEINSVTILMPNTTYSLPKDYHDIKIFTIKAKHDEILSDQYAIGFILSIRGVKVGFTGDTGWDYDQPEMMVKPFIHHETKLMVAHLGSIKSKEFEYVKAICEEDRNNCFQNNHLGLLGITTFLDKTRPKLTVISEFGEELRNKRKEIAEGIGTALDLKCLPGDIGLYIKLKDLSVYCFIEKNFINYDGINVYSLFSEHLLYHRNEPDQDIFGRALENVIKMKGVPIADRIKK